MTRQANRVDSNPTIGNKAKIWFCTGNALVNDRSRHHAIERMVTRTRKSAKEIDDVQLITDVAPCNTIL